MGEPEHALQAYTAALAIYQKMGYQERIAGAKLNLGAAHYDAGRFDQAIIAYQSSLDIFQKMALPLGQAQAHYNLAEAYIAQRRAGPGPSALGNRGCAGQAGGVERCRSAV